MINNFTKVTIIKYLGEKTLIKINNSSNLAFWRIPKI